MVEAIHKGLAGLTRSEAADMRTWHWLCAVAFPELVIRRWQTCADPRGSDDNHGCGPEPVRGNPEPRWGESQHVRAAVVDR